MIKSTALEAFDFFCGSDFCSFAGESTHKVIELFGKLLELFRFYTLEALFLAFAFLTIAALVALINHRAERDRIAFPIDSNSGGPYGRNGKRIY